MLKNNNNKKETNYSNTMLSNCMNWSCIPKIALCHLNKRVLISMVWDLQKYNYGILLSYTDYGVI